LSCPLDKELFILDTDASNFTIGAVLLQVMEVITYFANTLKKLERNYCATLKELLGVVKLVEHFHYF
jgi:hypothetical protein